MAEHLHITENEIVEGRTAGNAYTAGTIEAAKDAEPEGPLARHLGYTDSSLGIVEYLESLKPLIAALPDRERTILALRFTGELTQSEIGARLGISQMHVSRLLARLLGEFREALLAED